MKTKYSTARRRVTPATLSKLIRSADEAISAGTPVWLVARKSDGKHDERSKDAQLKQLTEWCFERGAVLVGSTQCTTPGHDPNWLYPAVDGARKHRAVILAETTARLIRSAAFDPSKQYNDMMPNTVELASLRTVLDGVVAATLLDPDADPKAIHAQQVTRGQAASGNKGGRPKRTPPGKLKADKERLQPIAKQLRNDGWSYRKIEAELGIPMRTIYDWLNA